jgi:hypothetical protein
MAGDAVLGNGGENGAGGWIDDGEAAVAFLGNQQPAGLSECDRDNARQQHEGKKQPN